LAYIAFAKDIYRVYGDKQLFDKLSSNYRAVFAMESMRTAKTPSRPLKKVKGMSDKLNRKFDIWFLIYLLFTVSIILLNVYGYISFGYGLGDVFSLGVIFLIAVFLSFIYIIEVRKLNKPLGKLIFMGVLLADIIVIVLYLTIFRGPEFPWHGNLFLR
jgi:heme/copper-type cytochrome/quinol oxidase subunit 4